MNNSMQQRSPFWLAIGGMLAMAAAMGIGRFVYTPILPIMVEQLGLSQSQAGLIASSNFLGYLLGAMIAATQLLQGSPRRWLLTALILSTITTAAMAYFDSYVSFLFVRFVGGLVSSWVLVFATTLIIERLVNAGRGELTAILFAGVGVGIVLAAVVTAVAVKLDTGWRGAWLLSGIVALIATLIVAMLVPDRERKAEQESAKDSAEGSRLRGLLSAYGLFGFGYVITATFIVQLVRDANYSLAVETWVWIVVGAAVVPSIGLWNRLAAKTSNVLAFAIACIVLAIGVAASVLSQSVYGLMIAAVCLGATFMGITALGLVEARRRASVNARRTLALMTASFGAGQIIGPAVAGFLVDRTGSFFLPSMLAVATLIAAASIVLIEKDKLEQ
ncbi:MAG: YbfB/YjiJ family MFS transporter [Acidiferrobacterales bacterium]|nr:YbfB/YjiJ family MFS transporter [Acidiferrobacterales bacterium]